MSQNQRPDKVKIIDEEWTDEHIQSFIHILPPKQSGEDVKGDPDYYVLLRAYQAMRVADFDRFLDFFTESGRDLNAKGPTGENLIAYIQNHRKAKPFIEAMNQHQVV